jgi:YidC/Oxa1 family membrane protein insertase
MNNNSGFAQFQQMKNAETASQKKGFPIWGWVALALCVYWLVAPSKKEAPVQETVEAAPVDISKVPKVTVGGDKIEFLSQGLRISNITLKGYKSGLKKNDGADIKLLAGDQEFAEIGFLANGTSVPTANSIWKKDGTAMVWKSESGVEFRRTTNISDGYVITVSDEIRNKSKKPVSFSQYVRIARNGGEASKFAVHAGAVADIGGDIKTESWKDVAKDGEIWQAKDGFAGFTDQYWEVVAASRQPSDKTIKIKRRGDKMFQADMAPEYLTLDAGQAASVSAEIFAGPKTQDALLAASKKIANIDRTIDYGWFGFLSRPFLWTLNKLHDFVPNYGVAIILLTLIIRGLMWPLAKKSIRAAGAMQKIQPELARLQKLYSNDKIRMQQEVMRLYQTHKANPFSSIGVMLLQIPIFFALYKALLIAVPLRHAGFLWVSDLSVMDPYFVLPVLMAGVMWLQNKMGKNTADAPGAKIMKWMPLLFGVMFATMPAGLVLYWTISSIAGIIQTRVIQKREK